MCFQICRKFSIFKATKSNQTRIFNYFRKISHTVTIFTDQQVYKEILCNFALNEGFYAMEEGILLNHLMRKTCAGLFNLRATCCLLATFCWLPAGFLLDFCLPPAGHLLPFCWHQLGSC
jgi:hypothetical protein